LAIAAAVATYGVRPELSLGGLAVVFFFVVGKPTTSVLSFAFVYLHKRFILTEEQHHFLSDLQKVSSGARFEISPFFQVKIEESANSGFNGLLARQKILGPIELTVTSVFKQRINGTFHQPRSRKRRDDFDTSLSS